MDTCLDHVPNIIIIFLKRQFVQYNSRLDDFAQIDEDKLFSSVWSLKMNTKSEVPLEGAAVINIYSGKRTITII